MSRRRDAITVQVQRHLWTVTVGAICTVSVGKKLQHAISHKPRMRNDGVVAGTGYEQGFYMRRHCFHPSDGRSRVFDYPVVLTDHIENRHLQALQFLIAE